jgi:hypothetical protein
MKQFDEFRAALEALCVEHGVRISGDCGYDCGGISLEVASERKPAGCELEFDEHLPPTLEEEAALRVKAEQDAARRAAEMARVRERAEWLQSPEYHALCARNQREAQLTRENQMRVSTDPADPAYIDARPRRVWLNDREVLDWTVADEFRRCVVTAAGVLNGSVLIERLPEPGAPVIESAVAECVGGLSGVFVAVPEPTEAPSFAPPVVVPVVAKPAKAAKKHKRGH